jgi:hypothetical protein
MEISRRLADLRATYRRLLLGGALFLAALAAAGCDIGSKDSSSKRGPGVTVGRDAGKNGKAKPKKPKKQGGQGDATKGDDEGGGPDGDSGATDADGGGDDGGGGGGGGGASLTEAEAFERSVFPLLKDNCAGCHAAVTAPFFAQENAEASRLAVLESGKVNFLAVERSRLYLRLSSDNHNCWSTCTEDSAKMKAALDEWLRLLLEINPKFLDEQGPQLVTGERAFGEAEQRTPTPDPMTIVVEAETARLTAPMAVVPDAKASGGSYVAVPAGNGGTINDPNQPNGGTSVFNVTAPTAGTYKIWALISAPTDANNAFFIRMDGGGFERWVAPVTMANWVWAPANTQEGQAELSFTLTAGAHTLEIKRRDVDAKLDRIALTANPAFDGSQADNGPFKVLRYDISELAGKPNTFFEIEIDDFSEAAFKVRRPTIVSEQPLSVKGVRLLVNGQYNPQHNTYNLIDMAVTPPRTQLSRAAMVVLKENGVEADKLSFTFEVLQ